LSASLHQTRVLFRLPAAYLALRTQRATTLSPTSNDLSAVVPYHQAKMNIGDYATAATHDYLSLRIAAARFGAAPTLADVLRPPALT